MRPQFILLALAIAFLRPFASAQWVQTNGPYGGNISCLAASGENLFAGTYSGVFLSTNNGTSWTAVNNGLPKWPYDTTVYAVGPLAVSGANLFAGTGSSGVFLSTNNGTSWSAANNGLPRNPSGDGYLAINCIASNGQNLFAGTGYGNRFERFDGGVFLSTDNGTSWTPVNTGLRSPYVHALAVSGTNLIAACRVCFGDCFSDSLFVSTNSGTSWTAVNSGLVQNHWSLALAASGTNFFVGTDLGPGVFCSTNSGTSWTATNEGLPYMIVNDSTRLCIPITCLKTSGTNLFAGTDWGGVFLSTNNGTSWTAVNEGWPRSSVNSAEYASINCSASNGQNLFGGTGGYSSTGGVWRRPLSEMVTDVEGGILLPTSFVLRQNYPNPFNPSTTIRYELPKSSEVRLTVFDMLGREVSVLVNERRNAGIHEVRFDASGLSSGVYFYRLQAGTFVETRKLLLLK